MLFFINLPVTNVTFKKSALSYPLSYFIQTLCRERGKEERHAFIDPLKQLTMAGTYIAEEGMVREKAREVNSLYLGLISCPFQGSVMPSSVTLRMQTIN